MNQGIDVLQGGTATQGLAPIERIAKALARLLQRVELTPSDFADLLQRYSAPASTFTPGKSGDPSLTDATVNYATGVLSGWHDDPLYVDELGEPVPIRRDGEAPSLHALFLVAAPASRAGAESGDFDALVRRLEEHGSIERLDDGRYRALSRTFVINAKGTAINVLLSRLADFTETIDFNAAHGGRFERLASVEGFPARLVPLLMANLEDKGMGFLEEIDRFIEKKRSEVCNDAHDQTKEVGIGMYLVVRDG